MAVFERDLIRERTLAGLARARAQGKKLGRSRKKRGYEKQGGVLGVNDEIKKTDVLETQTNT